MTDNKEHHFCFAFRGERMRITPFETLHFANVQGTSTLDGIQLVRISLERKNGRRASSIPKIIDEYNAISGIDPITPVSMPGMAQLITCFKTNRSFDGISILQRIEMDRATSSRYWNWNTVVEEKTPKIKKSRFSGLEGLVRELNMDPSTLCMQSAYTQVAKAYFQIKGVELKNSGTFPESDKEFLLAELRRHFDRERMFIVAPPPAHKELTVAAKAITEGSTMDDLRFKAAKGDDRQKDISPVAVAYFEAMLPKWKDDTLVETTFKEVLAQFNCENAGIYRRTCIVPFMAPFTSAGSVEITATGLRIDVERVFEQLKK